MAARAATVGRYALYDEIASGGMAVVHLGRLMGPAGFARTVAIKRLHPHLARDPEFVAMFLDEARLAARVRHPNVVSTLDVVAAEGELFVVMESGPGDSRARPLRAAAGRGERAPLPIAASILVNVLHGLHAAHEASDERGQPLALVHRDVSPQNVLVGVDGAAHVIDFGIAKAAGRVGVTREGQLKGKLAYMAPEQLRGERVDRRADVFGAAVVFWEMLTGQRLFDGADEGVIYGKVLRADVKRPSKVTPGLGKAADAIALRGLARDPAKRYETARAMALAIESALPLARSSQVGAWVERLTAATLEERKMQIAAIEDAAVNADSVTGLQIKRRVDSARNIPTAPGGRPGMDEASAIVTRPTERMDAGDSSSFKDRSLTDASFTDTSLVSSELEAPPRSSGRGAMLALASAALLVAAVGLAMLRPTPPHLVSAIASQATAIASMVAESERAPAPATPSPVSDSVSPESLPLATAMTAKAPARRAPATTRPAPPSCDPPYTLDTAGNKKYKRECASW